MKKKKSLFVKIGCFLMAIAVAIIPFLSFSKPNDKVYADSVDQFFTYQGSNLITVASNLYLPIGNTYFGVTNFAFDFSFLDNGLVARCHGTSQFRVDLNLNGTYFNFDSSWSISTLSGTDYLIPLGDGSAFLKVYYKLSSFDFNNNVYKIRIYSDVVNDYYYYTHIVYYDLNDNFIDFAVYAYDESSLALNYFYSDRYYYLVNPTTFSDNQIYNSGYDAGYNAGNTVGYSDGYNVGNNNGYNTGYGVGYNAGVLDINDYTFLGLFGAVIDAPIKAFTGLLDFNILGFNMAGFLIGLFSISIVLLIIRFIKG